MLPQAIGALAEKCVITRRRGVMRRQMNIVSGVAGENGGGVAVVRDEEDSGDTTPCRMTKVT